jgi:copper chaperone CopZ
MEYCGSQGTMGILSILGFATAAQTQQKPAAGQMCVLKVSGMHCGACANTVEKAAKKVEGVVAAKASQPNGTAEITYDPTKTSPAAIAKVINEQTPFKAEVPKKSDQKK